MPRPEISWDIFHVLPEQIFFEDMMQFMPFEKAEAMGVEIESLEACDAFYRGPHAIGAMLPRKPLAHSPQLEPFLVRELGLKKFVGI